MGKGKQSGAAAAAAAAADDAPVWRALPARETSEQVLASYGISPAFSNQVPATADERDLDSPDAWVRRRPEMLRLTGLHPFNSEAPLSLLMNQGFITPTSLHYVRNHGPVPQLAWDTHRVAFHGLDGKVVGELSMEDLTTLFPKRTMAVSLSCAGNRRKEANMIKQSKGFSWGCAAVSTSVWTGVRVADVLEYLGLLDDLSAAKYVCFDGVDKLPNGTYGTSIAIETVLDPARDVLLAFEQNGERLAPDHGFPVRLLVPGFIGGRSIKWLGAVKLSAVESDSWYHYFDNRLPPPNVDQETVKNDDSWFKRPEYIINDRNINSAISAPAHDEVLVLGAADKTYTIGGYAYNGGGRRITRVEVTLDNGASWELAEMTQPERPTPYGRYWCWTFWSLTIDPMRLLQCREIACRAWDESTNTQPGNRTWSILGMMQNSWFRVKISPLRTASGLAITFRHPATIEAGGWMEDLQAKEAPASTPVAATPPPDLPSFTLAEVEQHKSEDDCWIVLHGRVYDVTAWLDDHPGGVKSILGNAGKDSSKFFDAIHSAEAREMLDKYLVGLLAGKPAKL